MLKLSPFPTWSTLVCATPLTNKDLQLPLIFAVPAAPATDSIVSVPHYAFRTADLVQLTTSFQIAVSTIIFL